MKPVTNLSMKPQLLLFVLVAVLISYTECYPKDKVDHTNLLFDCGIVMGRMVKKTIKTFGVCTKEVQANSTKEEFPKKMKCVLKCTLGKMDLLTKDGKITKDTIQKFMDKNIPEEAHDLGHVLLEDCLESHTSKLDPKQPYCESYGEIVECMQNTIGDFAERAKCSFG